MLKIGDMVRITGWTHFGVVGVLAHRDRHGVLVYVAGPEHGESCYYGAKRSDIVAV
jgi:hypothetical protein